MTKLLHQSNTGDKNQNSTITSNVILDKCSYLYVVNIMFVQVVSQWCSIKTWHAWNPTKKGLKLFLVNIPILYGPFYLAFFVEFNPF